MVKTEEKYYPESVSRLPVKEYKTNPAIRKINLSNFKTDYNYLKLK